MPCAMCHVFWSFHQPQNPARQPDMILKKLFPGTDSPEDELLVTEKTIKLGWHNL